jgi:hypothetical protein
MGEPSLLTRVRAGGRARRILDRDDLDAAFALLTMRFGIWLLVVVSLLWVPLRGERRIPPFGAYGPVSDLVFGAFAQWDAVWFVHIAESGYHSEQITAFFPLYPLLVAGLAAVLRSTVVAGVAISVFAGGVAAALLARVARPSLGGLGARDAVLYLALAPGAFVFTAVYSDALFLALALGSFLAAQRRAAIPAGVLGALAVETRLIGLALIPALVYLLWPRDRSPRELARLLPIALLPASLGAYALYLERTFGDATTFMTAQGTYWNRDVPTLGPVGGLWEASSSGWHSFVELVLHLPRKQGYPLGIQQHDQWATWNVVHILLLAATLWLTWVAWRRIGPAFGLYSAATLTIILSSTAQFVPLVSLPRFVVADFPLFIALARVTDDRPRARQAVLIGLAAISAVAAVAFSRKVWVA